MKGVDFRIINRFVGGLENVLSRFPFLTTDSISGVVGEDMGLTVLGKFDSIERTLKITSRRNYEHIKRILFEEKRDGYKSTAHINGVVYHEMGHALHSFVLSMVFEHPDEISELNKFLRREFKRVVKNTGLLSDYGSESIEEMIAECFAEYMAEENPRKFSKMVIEKILYTIEICQNKENKG